MLKHMICALSAAVTLFSTVARAEDHKSLVAVLELANQAKLSRGEISTLSQFVREGAMQLPPSKYMLITKENISVMLPPDVRLEDCLGECEVETGRLIGAHYILSGQVVKFGAKIQINLNLHDTKTAQVKASGSVSASKITLIEKPLREKSIELLVELEPSLKKQSVGLAQGLRLERRHLAVIPNFDPKSPSITLSDVEASSSDRPRPIDTAGIVSDDELNITALELLENAVQAEKDPKRSPQEIIALWKKIEEYSLYKKIAMQRVQIWSTYLQRLTDHKQSQQRSLERMVEEIKRGLQHLADIEEDDKKQTEKRTQNMREDWDKLSRLLALSVVSSQKKRELTEVFVETYGVHEELNPYMKRPELVTLLKEERRAQLLEENIQENTERFRRTADLSKQRTLLIGRLNKLNVQARELGLQTTSLPPTTHMSASQESIGAASKMAPAEWYCVCYLERYNGRPTMSTACRLSLEACNGLRDKVMEGTRLLVAGSAGPCVRGAGATPWEATLSSQSVWRPSKRAGAWWTADGCFNGQ